LFTSIERLLAQVLERQRNAFAQDVDRRAPAVAALLRLVSPFQKMSQQHGHAAGEFALFAFPHVFDLVGQMFDVELGKTALARQARLLLRPENDVRMTSFS
jgi:hypothetical protein